MKTARKVLFVTVLMTVLILACSAFAQEETHNTGQEKVLNTVTVDFVAAEISVAIEGDIVFNLYDESGENLLSTQMYPYTRKTGWFRMEFEVPGYEVGTKFKLQLAGGAEGIKFGDVTSTEHIIETYLYAGEDGSAQYQTHFYMELLPTWYKQAKIKIPFVDQTEFYHSVIGDEVYVTTDLLDKLEIKYKTNFNAEKPSFMLYSEDKAYSATFYVDDIYALIGGVGENLALKTFVVDNMPYVPLSRIARYFACNYKLVSDGVYSCEISLTPSEYAESYKKAKFVNEKGISSRTEYLIWISKKDYKVSVYRGEKGNWRFVKSATCAIGAPSTPTIEGSFEYIDRQSRWQYDGYYCGPIMRFYRGYALHSTLIRNNGTPLDNRVGVKISHGCIRLRPDDINWLYKTIPMYTRIYITA